MAEAVVNVPKEVGTHAASLSLPQNINHNYRWFIGSVIALPTAYYMAGWQSTAKCPSSGYG